MSSPQRSRRTDNLFNIGELPPLGVVPKQMHASVIRGDRYGPPDTAFQTEVVDVPPVPPGYVLVAVMAAGINYNNVWAALGRPLDVIGMRAKRGGTDDFHIGGSEGSGIVWETGEGVQGLSVGQAVVLSGCRWDEHAEDVRLGNDPMLSSTQEVWGYELNWGSFAQFTLVADYQCHPKPPQLTWEEAACFLLSGATAYRQLTGWPPNTVRPGDPVLIWGGSGGLGSMACQLVNQMGGRAVAVVSSQEKAEYCLGLGAVGTIDRRKFDHWGRTPDPDTAEHRSWSNGLKEFGRAIWDVLGERRSPSLVFEHPGSDTMATSVFVCAPGGMIVVCGATSGYHIDVDLRILWMRQKRLQGSHFANLAECRNVIALTSQGLLDPCLGHVYDFDQIGAAHQNMQDGIQSAGNLAALVGAKTPGLGQEFITRTYQARPVSTLIVNRTQVDNQ
ncbi:crotonyl-CoA carboxylase/reductase [Nocardia speluncae]|uniref:Crotonyl-CoA carboxylase/reductase n=1 Tax=Nocardia speluncae TaxID=419477 RepID=A0A846XJ74_9NOCA|nr:crotonyl-CoA carboxylase/reductase [Nocardia speluncae]NKY33864.1 crotonyl-CoA carboxylase/reductase [Nocardia speluncae]